MQKYEITGHKFSRVKKLFYYYHFLQGFILLSKRMKTIVIYFILLLAVPAMSQKPAKVDHGIKKYGNVAFADTAHHKYPIDTDKHIRIAWMSIHAKKHAARYSKEELTEVKRRILAAAAAHGIHFKSTD